MEKSNEVKPLYSFYVAGVKFHKLKTIIKDLKEGDELTLDPDPTNKYDSNAIKILSNGTMCGYVPKKLSAEVSAELAIEKVSAYIAELNPNAKTWEQLKVNIFIDEDGDENE